FDVVFAHAGKVGTEHGLVVGVFDVELRPLRRARREHRTLELVEERPWIPQVGLHGLSPKMMSSDRLLITSRDARKRSVARAQLVPFGEVALARPVQARMAERQLRRVRPRGCATRRAWNACAMALGVPLSARLAIAR